MRPIFDETFATSFSALTQSPDETAWIIIVGLIRRAQWAWPLLDVMQKNRMRRLIAGTSVDDVNGRFIISEVLSINELRDDAMRRLQDFSLADLRKLEDRIPIELLLDEGVRRLSNSDSWSNTYSIIDTLLRPDVKEMNRSHVAAILTAFESNDDVRGSYASLPLLRAILVQCSDDVIGPAEEWEWAKSFALQPDTRGGSRFLTAYQETFGNGEEISPEEGGSNEDA